MTHGPRRFGGVPRRLHAIDLAPPALAAGASRWRRHSAPIMTGLVTVGSVGTGHDHHDGCRSPPRPQRRRRPRPFRRDDDDRSRPRPSRRRRRPGPMPAPRPHTPTTTTTAAKTSSSSTAWGWILLAVVLVLAVGLVALLIARTRRQGRAADWRRSVLPAVTAAELARDLVLSQTETDDQQRRASVGVQVDEAVTGLERARGDGAGRGKPRAVHSGRGGPARPRVRGRSRPPDALRRRASDGGATGFRRRGTPEQVGRAGRSPGGAEGVDHPSPAPVAGPPLRFDASGVAMVDSARW